MSKEGEALQRKLDEWLAMPLEQLAKVNVRSIAFVFKGFKQRIERAEALIEKSDHISLLQMRQKALVVEDNFEVFLQLKRYNEQFLQEQQAFAEVFGEYNAIKPQLDKLHECFVECLNHRLEHDELTPEVYAEEKEGLERCFHEFHAFFMDKQATMPETIAIQQSISEYIREIERLLPLVKQRRAQEADKAKAVAKERTVAKERAKKKAAKRQAAKARRKKK